MSAGTARGRPLRGKGTLAGLRKLLLGRALPLNTLRFLHAPFLNRLDRCWRELLSDASARSANKYISSRNTTSYRSGRL
jgi:hypothetical protein